MNTYEIEFKGDDEKETVIAETKGKAKYQVFLYLSEFFEWRDGFLGFLKSIKSVKLVHKFQVSDLYVNDKTFERVLKNRNIEFAYLGMKVKVDGKMGTITGGNSSGNLDICFDGSYHSSNCHPHWETVYFDRSGKIVKDYRKKV